MQLYCKLQKKFLNLYVSDFMVKIWKGDSWEQDFLKGLWVEEDLGVVGYGASAFNFGCYQPMYKQDASIMHP